MGTETVFTNLNGNRPEVVNEPEQHVYVQRVLSEVIHDLPRRVVAFGHGRRRQVKCLLKQCYLYSNTHTQSIWGSVHKTSRPTLRNHVSAKRSYPFPELTYRTLVFRFYYVVLLSESGIPWFLNNFITFWLFSAQMYILHIFTRFTFLLHILVVFIT